MFTPLHIILMAGAFQGIILAVAIGSASRFKDRARLILASIVAIFSAGIIVFVVTHQYFDRHLIHSSFIALFFLLFAPLLYLYVKAMTGQRSSRVVFHFLPFLGSLIAVTDFAFIYPEKDAGIIHVLLTVVITAQVSVYTVLTIRAFMAYSNSIRENFSSVEKIDLVWLRFLTGAFFVSWILVFTIEIIPSHEKQWDYFWIFVSGIIYLTGYVGLTRPSAFISADLIAQKEPVKATDDAEKKKYKKTAISSEKISEYRDNLEKTMLNDKPFLEPEISMPALAEKIGMQPHHLSQVINECYGMNFFEFINRKRIDTAKEMIDQLSGKDLNITRVAFDSGFNSISSFNSSFKKFTGMTPSEYRDKEGHG